MSHESKSARLQPKTKKRIVALAVLLVGGLLLLWDSDFVLFPKPQTATVVVLDDCDDDYKTPPFEDALIAFGPNGARRAIATNLNHCQTVGGSRALSVSPDGRFLLVCEEVARHLTAYETQTGKPLWSVDGQFNSATVAPDGTVYAIASSGTIYGDRTVMIDQAGRITQSGSVAGFDIALDSKREVIWLVGKYIKRCDLQLHLLQELSPIKWCGVSADVAPDGSLWVAEREHRDVAQSTNRIFKVSADGQLLKSISLPWSPMCVRVDESDGAVWVTGIEVNSPFTKQLLDKLEARTGALPLGKWLRAFLTERRVCYKTQQYDADGRLLHQLAKGGHSLSIQRSDGSVWLAGKDKLYHYSREATKLAVRGGVSSEQKYIVVLPEPGR
jgi:hypothetical protein